jgi:hypothetical protein
VSALDDALALAAAGYHLAPVTIRRGPDGRKRPHYHGRWGEISTTDPERIRDWFVQYGPDVSYCIDTGKTGITAIDLDVAADHDAAAEWAAAQMPTSPMMVITPSGGVHYYWRTPPGAAIPNSAGAIGRGVDVRGVGGHVFAPGGGVVGEAITYEMANALVPVRELPELPAAVLEAIPTERRTSSTTNERRANGATHDRDWVIRACKDQIERVRTHAGPSGGFRDVLLGASMMYGRAIAAGVTTRAKVEERLGDACHGVWGADPDPEDLLWMKQGIDDGLADPWTVVDTQAESEEINADEAMPDPRFDPEGYALALQLEVRKARLRRDAAAQLAAENRPVLRVLSAAEFLASEQPTYLVPRMIYADSLAVVFGPPGAAKSFLALDLALHLATGRAWQGTELARTRVHYVMAEGQAVSNLRAQAWLIHHGVSADDLDGWFDVIPQAILLTEDGVKDYVEVIRRDRPGMIVLDTKHAMLAGDSSKDGDIAIMRRALDEMRRASGAAMVLIDHTGLANEDRTRGSNAQQAASDTEIKVSNEGGVRLVEVKRDKASEPGTSWAFQLEQVPATPRRPGIAAPAVCVPVDTETLAAQPFGDGTPAWRDPDGVPIPEDIVDYRGKGRASIADLARFMRENATGGIGMALSDAKTALCATKDMTGKPLHDRATVGRAWGALFDLGRLAQADTGQITGRALWLVREKDPE